jgi:stage V sporulation protein SpoVS
VEAVAAGQINWISSGTTVELQALGAMYLAIAVDAIDVSNDYLAIDA